MELDEMEKGWNIYTIDEVNLTGCRQKKFVLRAVTNKYDDKKGENHHDNLDEFDTWEINPMAYACIAEYYKNVPGLLYDCASLLNPNLAISFSTSFALGEPIV